MLPARLCLRNLSAIVRQRLVCHNSTSTDAAEDLKYDILELSLDHVKAHGW